MIAARANRLKAARPALGRLPLDLAKQVELRRSTRLAEYRHIQGNNALQYDIHRAVELENQRAETHRMEDALRSGMLESQSHPILAAMARRGATRASASATRARPEPSVDAMEVDSEEPAARPSVVPRSNLMK